jgi:predicted Zn-dependent peptidase
MRKLLLVLVLALLLIPLSAYEFEKMKDKVVKYVLPNGATVLVLENHEVPIAHCISLARVGAVNEEPGKSGIAHFLEHLAFKGTTTIGTTNYRKEKKVMAEADAIFDKIISERAKADADPVTLASLQIELDAKIEEASKYVNQNEFSTMLEERGGDGLNAGTSQDFTVYQLSVPSNKVEFWMAMEADRFTNPVFREFYRERKVILEERRMTLENDPSGKLMAKLADTAFQVHPYRIPVIGSAEDIESITRQDVANFFHKYYGANNLIIAIYGDVYPEEIKAYADKYFARIPSGEKAPLMPVEEPAQTEEKEFTLEENAQRFLFMGYHVPEENNPDYKALNALASILGQKQTSRLYTRMVEEDKIAMYGFSFVGYPGNIYPNLFLIGAIPAQNSSFDQNIQAIDEEVAKIKENGITDEEFTAYRKGYMRQYLRQLDSGQYLPMQLAMAEAYENGYEKLFSSIDEIEQMTKEDIQRVANKYLIPENRTIGKLVPKGE